MKHEESPALAEWALGLLPEWDRLLVSSLELVGSLLRARSCALFLLDRDRQRLVLASLWGEAGKSELDPVARELLPGSVEWEAVQSAFPMALLRPQADWLGSEPASGGAGIYPCGCAAVDVEGTRFGVVEVVRAAGDEPLGPADLEALQTASRHVALWLANSALLRRLRELAITDGLTAVYNHRYFQDRLDLELERAARYNRPLSVMMMDLNHFKRYNDLFGHQQGDDALRLIAATIQRVVRRPDVVARYGGDEFAVILPETSSLQAVVVAARVVRALRTEQALAFPDSGGDAERLSLSAGISAFPELATAKDQLIGQADYALYRAKRSRTRKIQIWERGWLQEPPEPEQLAAERLL